MNDPYSTLGVSPSASDEEVKRAYRDLARKYHPDNYVDNPLADLAAEKMKEINEAYDEIQKRRSGGGSTSSGGSYGGNRQNPYGGTGRYAQIRQMISMGNIAGAEQMLRANSDGSAEWNFLMGAVCYRKGWLDDARRYYQTACQMEPNNPEYRQALNMMNSGGVPYGAAPYQTGGVSPCDCCSSLLMADCCCECMGGDLISCC